MKANNVGIRLLVNDFKKSFDFYHDILGFKLNGDIDAVGEVYANFITNGTYFSIFKKENNSLYKGYSDIGSQSKSDFVTLTIGFDSTKDIDEQYDILKSKGVNFIGAPRNMPAWEFRCVQFRDPEGNLLELGGPLK